MLRRRSSDLDVVLKNPRTTLLSVLKIPDIVSFYRFGFEPLVNFFRSHIHDLLECAFHDDRAITTLNAYRILSFGKPQLIVSLFESGKFPDFCLQLTFFPETPLSSCIIGRLSRIILTVFYSQNQSFLSECTFVFRLLKYADNHSVIDLFSTISGNPAGWEKVHRWLIDSHYAEILAHELADLNEENEFRIAGLTRLVKEGLNSSILGPSFNSKLMISVLTAKIEQSWMVENGRWRAVCALCGSENYRESLDFAVKAYQVICDVKNQLHEYHVSALLFLTKFVDVRNDLFDEALVRNVMDLVLKYPQNSVLQAAAKEFVVASLPVAVIMRRVVRMFVPVLLVECGFREHGVLPMFAFSILEEVAQKATGNVALQEMVGEIAEFGEFVSTTLKSVTTVREAEYGGMLPMIRRFPRL